MATAQGDLAFVGREQELSELTAALDDAVSGRGRLMMLVGEPGIGKTRLAEELAASAHDSARVLWGRCPEEQGAPPYWPWAQLIRAYVSECDVDRLRDALGRHGPVVAGLIPEVREALPDLEPAPETTDPEQARFRLFDAVTSFFGRAASAEPLLLILDDLHWADTASLRLLEFAATGIPDAAVMLLGTYRDVELSRRHPLAETLGSIGTGRAFRRVPLRGLTRSGVGRLVAAVAGVEPAGSLVEEIHDRTTGNPFFVSEVARDLVDSGRLDDHGNGNGMAAEPMFRIPEGVHEAIGRRLNRLSELTNEVLTAAAAIGRDFRFEPLQTLVGDAGEPELLDSLEEALGARLIEEVPGEIGRYRFVHALVEETLTAELSVTRRVRLQARVAVALEESYGNDADAHAAELARHFAEAEAVLGTEKLVHYCRIAGERALATYAWEEALGHFQRGLAAKEGQAMDADRAALLFGLGRAQTHALERHRVHEAATTVRPAFEYYVATEDVPAALAIAEYPIRSLHERTGAAELLAEALKLVPSDSPQAGRLLQRYGAALSTEIGNFEAAIEALNQALAIAQRENDTALEVSVLNRMASAHTHMRHNPQEGLEHSLQAIELGRSFGQLQGQQQGHWWAAAALINLGDLERARPHAAASLAMAEKRGDRFNIGQVLSISECIAHLQGNWETARDFSDRGLAVDHRDARHVSNRAILEYELGDFDQGDTYLERLVETMRLSPPAPTLEYSITSLAIGVAARITGAARQFDVADAAADTVLSSPSPVSFIANLATTGLALIAVERGDVASAREQYDALRSWRITLTGMNLVCGHRVLGLLARTMGRMDDAVAHFEESLAFCRKAGARPELAWTSYDYADALLQRHEPSAHSRAMSLIDQALAISTELGMRPLAEKTIALEEQAERQDVAVNVPAYPAGLTEREVGVLRLVASGKSNAEIARELVLSIRTVERHVSNIYGKTGSGGRADATAFAFTSGLIPSE